MGTVFPDLYWNQLVNHSPALSLSPFITPNFSGLIIIYLYYGLTVSKILHFVFSDPDFTYTLSNPWITCSAMLVVKWGFTVFSYRIYRKQVPARKLAPSHIWYMSRTQAGCSQLCYRTNITYGFGWLYAVCDCWCFFAPYSRHPYRRSASLEHFMVVNQVRVICNMLFMQPASYKQSHN